MRSARQPSHSPHRGVRSNDVRDTRSPTTSWSRSYVSRSSTYQVSAEVTSSPELVATGATTMRCPSTGPSPWPASTRTTGRPRGWSSRRPTGPSPMPVSLRPSVPASPVLRSSGGPSCGYGPADSAALPVTHGVPAGELRYDVLGRGCSWHHDRRPIGAVPLAGKVTGACNTDRPTSG